MEYIESLRKLAAAEDKAAMAMIETRDDQGELIFTDEYLQAYDALASAYSPQKRPNAQRAMSDLQAEFILCRQKDDAVSDWFLNLRTPMQEAIAAEPPRRIVRQTPTELNAIDVPLRQIAYEWRWFVPGTDLPDTERVAREIAKPGSELTEEEIEKRWLYDLDQTGWVYHEPDPETVEHSSNEPVPAAPVVASGPPSLDKLVADGASIDQIVAIKQSQYGAGHSEWAQVVRLFARLANANLPENSQQTINGALKERADAIANAATPSGQRRKPQRERVSA